MRLMPLLALATLGCPFPTSDPPPTQIIVVPEPVVAQPAPEPKPGVSVSVELPGDAGSVDVDTQKK